MQQCVTYRAHQQFTTAFLICCDPIACQPQMADRVQKGGTMLMRIGINTSYAAALFVPCRTLCTRLATPPSQLSRQTGCTMSLARRVTCARPSPTKSWGKLTWTIVLIAPDCFTPMPTAHTQHHCIAEGNHMTVAPLLFGLKVHSMFRACLTHQWLAGSLLGLM